MAHSNPMHPNRNVCARQLLPPLGFVTHFTTGMFLVTCLHFSLMPLSTPFLFGSKCMLAIGFRLTARTSVIHACLCVWPVLAPSYDLIKSTFHRIVMKNENGKHRRKNAIFISFVLKVCSIEHFRIELFVLSPLVNILL